MRILMIGLFSFLAWSAFSGYYYVCNVKHLCGEELAATDREMMAEAAVEAEPEVLPEAKANEDLTAPEAELILFAYNSDLFENKDQLDVFAGKAKDYLENAPDMKLIITGHTDATGTESYNKDLGKRRAESVAAWCKSQGIPSQRLLTDTKGESAPIASNETADGRQKNRRVEFTFKSN